MASNEMYKTRAGIQPSEQELPFSITTTDVKNYMQRKLNAVVNGMRQNGLYSGDDIDVDIVTVEMGSNFIPFTVVLPMSVLKERKRRPKEELSIFNPKDDDATIGIYEPIMKMFSSYTFDKADGEAFFSADWRRARGVSTAKSAVLKNNRQPRIQRFNNGNLERVCFIIDPIRVFHDMLMMENNNTNFMIKICDWQKIRSGEFRYDMKRTLNNNKKKNKGGNTFADELNRKMNGFNK